MKYAVLTFGCRVNQADSLVVEEQLRAAGAEPSDTSDADVVVVNTCSVTASSDQGARQTIRRVAKANPAARIVVTGCYASRRPDELVALPNVVRVVPNDAKPELLQIVRGLRLASSLGEIAGEGPCGAALEPGLAGRTAFTLRVQTGCAEPCSYCIIPTTRGAPRSLAVCDVLSQIARVVDAGFKEIALTGVHLGSYGRDLDPVSSLEELLRSIVERFGDADVLFRISSLEPMDCTPGVVQLVADSGCLAPHFHLPLQHASDRVLAAMRRPYTLPRFSSLVNDIRRRLPHASIGSDVMVGFPGETDDDFEVLATYLAGSPLTHLHVFPYSDRPGTDASRMAARPPGTVVRERAGRIRSIGRALADGFRRSQVGAVHPALTLEDGSLAVTGNYLKVRIPPGRSRNTRVTLRVTAAGDEMSGVVIAS